MIAIIKQDAYPDELVKGECIIYTRHDDKGNPDKITSWGLIICCPKCGKTSTGAHMYNPDTKTLHPSIICNSITDAGVKCDFHGWLKNGSFIDV